MPAPKTLPKELQDTKPVPKQFEFDKTTYRCLVLAGRYILNVEVIAPDGTITEVDPEHFEEGFLEEHLGLELQGR
jgi:hypothetical protein